MVKKKPWKIKIPDSALKDVPEDKREEFKKTVVDLFQNADPEEIGKPVKELPEGSQVCPICGSPLEAGPTFSLPDGEAVQIFDCVDCDQGFMGKPLN